jgi:hypothetical protein
MDEWLVFDPTDHSSSPQKKLLTAKFAKKVQPYPDACGFTSVALPRIIATTASYRRLRVSWRS